MTPELDIVFAGTPDFAVPSLEALMHSRHRVRAVLTQPDRPAGRGRRLQPSPVKRQALEGGLTVLQPERLDAEARATLAALSPDLMVVVAYGLILPEAVLTLPRWGCWNVHASLLPRWRGAAPIQRAILAGDTETGVCIMRMERGLDTGDVIAAARTSIATDETAGELHDRLAVLGAETLMPPLETLAREGSVAAEPQDEARATYAAKVDAGEAELDWAAPAVELARRVRAFNPWPGARARVQDHWLKIWRARPVPGAAGASPGAVLGLTDDGLDVATGDGRLRLLEVQRSGRRRTSARELVNALPQLRGPARDQA